VRSSGFVGMCVLYLGVCSAVLSEAQDVAASSNDVPATAIVNAESSLPVARPIKYSPAPYVVPVKSEDKPEPQASSILDIKPLQPSVPLESEPVPAILYQYPEYYFYNAYLAYKLEIGARIKRFTLLDDTKGTAYEDGFFGSVTQLREDQNYFSPNLYAQYKILPFFGVGIAYDKFSMDAGDWGIEGPGTGGSDGRAVLSGPLLYVFGCYSNETRFTPFCELGIAMYAASFHADSAWYEEGRRNADLDGTKGFFLTFGCDLQVHEYVSIDLFARYMNVSDLKGEWFLLGAKAGDITLTPSYMAVGMGAKFMF